MTKLGNMKLSSATGAIDRFQLLVDAIKDYAIYMIDPEGHIISWNSGAERFKGYSELEILGRHFSCFYTREDVADNLPNRALTIARMEGRFEAEGWRVRKDGSAFWASVVIDPIWVNDDLVGYAKITRDITQRVKADSELSETREALRQAQKMEVLGRLTSGVAHDFNNMMTVIRTSTERLQNNDVSENEKNRYLQLMIETLDHATSLTTQLLTFARRQPLKPEQFDVVDRLLAIRPLLETTLGDSISLKMHLAPDLTRVDTDHHQFETAIINMVVNARDAILKMAHPNSPAVVTLTATPVSGIPPIREHAPVEGSYVAISIADTGPGIDDDVLPRIFEPFFTTKERHHGTGLGLSQVYGFVKQSGGEVEVVSEAGQGTRFTFYLPRVRRGVITTRLPVDSDKDDAKTNLKLKGTILLVEDNNRIAEVTTALLDDLGLISDCAYDAETALAKLNSDADKYDLVLTDVVMPGMSGIALARLITKSWPELPVLLTSGYSDDLTAGQGGEFDLIQKPYSRKALVDALSRHLDDDEKLLA